MSVVSKAEKSLPESEIREELGRFLRMIRKRRGYKSSEVARAIGKSVQYVCDIEKGRRGGSHLAPEVVVLWANYLNIPVSSITKRQNLNSNLDLMDEKAKTFFRIVRNKSRAARLFESLNDLSVIVGRLETGEVSVGTGARDLRETIVKINRLLEYTQ